VALLQNPPDRPVSTGYRMVGSYGGIFNYGDAGVGSEGGTPLNEPVVGIASAAELQKLRAGRVRLGQGVR
jgi:hypothetical protein